MWAYRLNQANDTLKLLKPFSAIRRALLQQHEVAGDETETLFQLDNDLKQARQMARAIGWDTSLAYPEQCFSLPGPDSTLYGFVLTQATSGARYVVSPVPLPYLDDHADWNARINSDEVKRTRKHLSGETVDEKPPLRIDPWKRSQKGNMYTQINGANVTIFPVADGGYKAIVMSPVGKAKVYTRAFQHELQVSQYVIQPENFYALIRDWIGGGKSTDLDSPFADIDWGDEDDLSGVSGPDDDIPF